jgi:hypothetical protein
MLIIKNKVTRNSKDWQGCEEKETFVHCGNINYAKHYVISSKN